MAAPPKHKIPLKLHDCVSIEKAAAQLGVSTRCIYQWFQSKKLTPELVQTAPGSLRLRAVVNTMDLARLASERMDETRNRKVEAARKAKARR